MASIVEGLQDVLHGAAREFSCEYPCLVGDQLRWFLLHAAVVDSVPPHFVVAHTDVTSRRLVEEQTAHQGLRRRALFKSAGEGFCIIDRIGRIAEANHVFCEMVGYPESELLTMRFHQLVVDRDENSMVRTIDEVLAAGPQNLQIKYQPRVGPTRDGEVRANPVRMQGQDVLFLSMRDVTEWKQQAEQRHMLLSMLDQAREAIALWDLEGRLCYLNHAAGRLSLRPREEALGQPAGQLLLRDEARFRGAMEELEAEGEWHGEFNLPNEEGEERAWESWWTLIINETGGPNAVLSINADVTERKRFRPDSCGPSATRMWAPWSKASPTT